MILPYKGTKNSQGKTLTNAGVEHLPNVTNWVDCREECIGRNGLCYVYVFKHNPDGRTLDQDHWLYCHLITRLRFMDVSSKDWNIESKEYEDAYGNLTGKPYQQGHVSGQMIPLGIAFKKSSGFSESDPDP